jgi:hypothetical protein
MIVGPLIWGWIQGREISMLLLEIVSETISIVFMKSVDVVIISPLLSCNI